MISKKVIKVAKGEQAQHEDAVHCNKWKQRQITFKLMKTCSIFCVITCKLNK